MATLDGWACQSCRFAVQSGFRARTSFESPAVTVLHGPITIPADRVEESDIGEFCDRR